MKVWQPIETIPRGRPAPVVLLKGENGRITQGWRDDGEEISYRKIRDGVKPPFVAWRWIGKREGRNMKW